jgi:hypothetical protein
MSTHYTAIIIIQSVNEIAEAKNCYNTITVKSERIVEEVAKIVVRASTIEILQLKVTAHVSLLNNDQPANPFTPKND